MALPKNNITAAQMAAAEEFISGKTQEPSITQPHTTLPNPKMKIKASS